ncbi:cupin-like domain-containing protein [Kordiimonas sp.]|uniref:cupin-like domain-containing protein n=1 Tax=Kordiimonas sp. TaxID=1970157 RepID=UPI003A956020
MAGQKVKEISGVGCDQIPFEALIGGEVPVVLKGVAKDWPLVKAGQRSPEDAMTYIEQFEAGREYTMYVVPPEVNGRIFYNEELTAPNYQPWKVSFPAFLEAMREQFKAADPSAHYIGSRDADTYFPGLRKDNDLKLKHPMFEHGNLLVSVWTGSKTLVAAHYDASNNLACCMVGRRRFTLFPPEAISALYPGPLEPTPGGQVLSMVDHHNPDLRKFPRFKEAEAMAQVAELEPGDVLYFPALWWHQVEALEPFNVMMNYWWNDVPLHIDDPRAALLHGMLALRERPEQEKKAWKQIFNYYVFGDAEDVRAHLPKHARGPLGELDTLTARRLRAYILQLLNR